MQDKYLFKIKKDNNFLLYTKKDFENLMEIHYLPKLIFDRHWIEKRIEKLCIRAAKDGFLPRESIWFGHFYEKEIKSHYIPDVYLKWIDLVKEFGLFANKDLPKAAFLGEYTGIVKKHKKIMDDRNPYLFEYSVGYKKTPYTIDAREQGSLIRFVNHSFKPNVTPLSVYLDGSVHIIFKTNRDVQKDEELTYDYGPVYWKKRENPIGER